MTDKHDPDAFRVGDTVRVVRKVETIVAGWDNSWVSNMDKYVGGTYPVAYSDDGGVLLHGGLGAFWFPSCALELVDTKDTSESDDAKDKSESDGSTASYYELPEGCSELQDLISFRNMNAQMGEVFRAVYRYGLVKHSPKKRDIKKIIFYAQKELERLEKYGE